MILAGRSPLRLVHVQTRRPSPAGPSRTGPVRTGIAVPRRSAEAARCLARDPLSTAGDPARQRNARPRPAHLHCVASESLQVRAQKLVIQQHDLGRRAARSGSLSCAQTPLTRPACPRRKAAAHSLLQAREAQPLLAARGGSGPQERCKPRHAASQRSQGTALCRTPERDLQQSPLTTSLAVPEAKRRPRRLPDKARVGTFTT